MKKPLIALIPLVDAGRDSLWMLPGYMECAGKRLYNENCRLRGTEK